MNLGPTLTIAVPTYNKEKYLPQNLRSLLAADNSEIEILVLDNSSDDTSGQIADEFAELHPHIVSVIHKENSGYGSSINMAIAMARGRYLRIVDADDWVDSKELSNLVQHLKECIADLVINDYTMVDTNTCSKIKVNMCSEGRMEDTYYNSIDGWKPFPQMHSTVFRVEFLRQKGISLLENTFYVDEQLMITSYLYAKTMIYYKCNVYYYRVGDKEQSVSISNMGEKYADREREIKKCLEAYRNWEEKNHRMEPCFEQLVKHAGNHFTTLYMYVEPPSRGRALAKQWQAFLCSQWPEIARETAWKRRILAFMNWINLRGNIYIAWKAAIKKASQTDDK